MHFYSIAHHLKDELGHQYGYHLALQKALQEQGIPCHVYIDRDAKIPYLPEGWFYFFRTQNRWLGNDFRVLLKDTSFGPRNFFLECFSFLELFHLTIACWLYGKNHDHLWLFLRRDLKQFKFQGLFHALLIRLLQQKFGIRLKLLTDSLLIKNELEERLQQPIQQIPLPHIAASLPPRKPLTPGMLFCYWPGEPRKAKGWDAIREILQFSSPDQVSIELIASDEARLFSSIHKIKAVAPILTHEDYWKELCNCDVVLLPYDPLIYRCSTSGIFVESVAAGKMPIVTDRTWLAHELRRFSLDELIVDWKHPHFWSQLHKIASDDAIRQKLEAMRTDYQGYHNLSCFGRSFAEFKQ